MASDMATAAQLAGSASRSLAQALESPTSALAGPMSSETGVVTATQGASGLLGWFGFLGWLLLSIINLVTTILYWVIRIATFNVPMILYTLFSTSWTVTMNATTL